MDDVTQQYNNSIFRSLFNNKQQIECNPCFFVFSKFECQPKFYLQF